MKTQEIIGRKIPWSFIGVIITLCSIIFALFLWMYERNPRVSFEITNESNILDVRKPLEELEISFQNQDIQKENLNLRIYTIQIENTGGKDIKQDFYDRDDIWGIEVQNARIIRVTFTDSNSDYLTSKLNPQIIDENTIKFHKVIFETGKYFTLEILILHKKEISQPEIIPIGKIAGIDRIIPVKSSIKREKLPFLSYVFYGDFFINIIRAIVYFFGTVILIILIALVGSKWNDSKSIHVKKEREREIEKVFGKEAYKEDRKEFLSKYYINYGIQLILELNKFLNNPKRVFYKIEKYDFEKKYEEDENYDDDIFGWKIDDAMEALIENKWVKRGPTGDLIIDRDFGKVLTEYIERFGEVRNKKH